MKNPEGNHSIEEMIAQDRFSEVQGKSKGDGGWFWEPITTNISDLNKYWILHFSDFFRDYQNYQFEKNSMQVSWETIKIDLR